jgi:CubicO group peptidase (beta-lactamase class C family)
MTWRSTGRSCRLGPVAIGLFLTVGCSLTDPGAPEVPTEAAPPSPSFDVSLSTYFPPSESNGGWRKTTDKGKIASLGIAPTPLAAFGAYTMSLPWENYSTGVSGYSSSNKASLVVKNGWIVGEFYNQESARTGVYYLASNGKTFAMMLLGRMLLEYPSLGITASSRVYDQRWLPEGFPLTDSRKANITFDHVFKHVSGIIPQVEAKIADGAVVGGVNWNFEPFTLGKDADYRVSAPLYFAPGNASTYTKGSSYSSVSFNHLGLIFQNVTGLESSLYLRRAMLDPIGVGRMAYKLPSGMGGQIWATGGNGLASARDYARLSYLLLHEGNWAGKRIFTSSWIRRFTTVAGYANISSNAKCLWGKQYPKDMYRIIGSGINIAFIVPSLDLVATLNGRVPNSLRDQVTNTFLQKLFASVTQQYVSCDGRTINAPPSSGSQSVTTLRLMNADTDQPIIALSNGATITLASLSTRNLNVRAETSPSTVGSVRFALDANTNYRTETAAPYALAGDDSGDYRPWTPSVGSHTLKATPYTGASAGGAAGTSLTVKFTVK